DERWTRNDEPASASVHRSSFIVFRDVCSRAKGDNTMVSPIPEQHAGPVPYLSVQGAAQAIDFYKQAFGATEVHRMADPSGTIGHAELIVGRGRLFLADEFPDHGFLGPRSLGGSAVMLHLYVD